MGRLQLRSQLLVAVVLVAAVAAAGCGRTHETDGTLTTLSTMARDMPLGESPIPGPRAPTPPDLVPLVGPSPSIDSTDDSETAHRGGSAPMHAAAPVRLEVPSIGVDSTLVDLGLQADGTLEVPEGGFPAGWYTGAPTPGEVGPAIIAGHVDWAGQPGVFFDLAELSSGDAIVITREDGSTARFRITRVERFDKSEFPTQEVYGDLDAAGLRLITCGGAFDPQARSYRDNVVVFAELSGSRS